MKLTKAKEILEQYLPDPDSVSVLDSCDAIQLGIEAIERCQELESPKNFSPMRPLPSETKE